MERKTGKQIEPSRLVIDVIEKEVLPRLQDGSETYLVVAQKELRILALPSLPGVPREETTGLMPRISKPERLRDKWHKDGLMGFVYVINGEADLLLGRRVVTCYAGNFSFFLPHTWRNRGFASHWERPGPAQNNCDLLWIFLEEKEVFCICVGLAVRSIGVRGIFLSLMIAYWP